MGGDVPHNVFKQCEQSSSRAGVASKTKRKHFLLLKDMKNTTQVKVLRKNSESLTQIKSMSGSHPPPIE